jgi:hypothetical protein
VGAGEADLGTVRCASPQRSSRSVRAVWEHTFVHSSVRQAALDLVAQRLDDCEVGRRLGVPRRAVRDWRVPPYVPRDGGRVGAKCFRSWRPTSPVLFTPDDCAELLGLYLGDGAHHADGACAAAADNADALRRDL